MKNNFLTTLYIDTIYLRIIHNSVLIFNLILLTVYVEFLINAVNSIVLVFTV